METENKTENQTLDNQLAEVTENWKRAVADYRNLEKRIREEREALASFSSLLILARIIPILDNLERAQKAHPQEGLDLIIKDFKKVLADEGVEEIVAVGQPFDPHWHEAVDMAEGEEGKVVALVEKGYKIKDQVLRPAKVKVGRKV
ncbi:MAG: nucleotide exchange factor GrpE [bacterium]|nr:nucleotide exchange factor GrpE [bacterium]